MNDIYIINGLWWDILFVFYKIFDQLLQADFQQNGNVGERLNWTSIQQL